MASTSSSRNMGAKLTGVKPRDQARYLFKLRRFGQHVPSVRHHLTAYGTAGINVFISQDQEGPHAIRLVSSPRAAGGSHGPVHASDGNRPGQ